MHIEFLVEDASGAALLEILVPKIFGEKQGDVAWRIHSYKGIGKIPGKLGKAGDPKKRILLDQLPRLLRGYSRTPGINAVVVVLDVDSRDCREFLAELRQLAINNAPNLHVLFRLAIEEIEAWYFGDKPALRLAYPKSKKEIVERYLQDSLGGTWEYLADAVHPGGSTAVKKAGWPLPGQLKNEWASKIGPFMDVDKNESPSFAKLVSGLRGLVNRMQFLAD